MVQTLYSSCINNKVHLVSLDSKQVYGYHDGEITIDIIGALLLHMCSGVGISHA